MKRLHVVSRAHGPSIRIKATAKPEKGDIVVH